MAGEERSIKVNEPTMAVDAVEVHQPPKVPVPLQTLTEYLEQESWSRAKYTFVDVRWGK